MLTPVAGFLEVHLPSLPDVNELEAILTGNAAERHRWPPPGMSRLTSFGSTAYVLRGRPSGENGDWWWSSASEVNPAVEVLDEILTLLMLAGVEVSAPFRATVAALGWVPLVYRQEKTMRWIRAAIHAQLGTSEELIHAFSFTPSGDTPAALPATADEGRAVATLIASHWQAALSTVTPGSLTALSVLSNELKYDAVRLSVLEQTQPRAKNGTGGDIETILPTVSAPFTPLLEGGATGPALPYEVACCVTLTTRRVGPSCRGRVFMGGLDNKMILSASGGRFYAPHARALAAGVGVFAERMRSSTPWQLSLVSSRLLETREIVGAKVGIIPDSQRRRRQSQAENAVVVWTSPTL